MGRTLALVLAVVLVFAAVGVIMLRLMPAPLKDSDYLIIGSVATLVSLLALFVVVVTTSGHASSVFFKRRKK
ncbi:MAG: hypothetical protein M3N41_06820 [Acidobacteriota bacterium]|nr:hypothetical protein [Acidobacteriota bacterium]